MIISVFCMIIGAIILLVSLFFRYVFIEEFILESSLLEMLNIGFFSVFMLVVGFGGLVTNFKNSLPKEELCYTEDEINIPEQTTPKPEPINEKYEQIEFKDL